MMPTLMMWLFEVASSVLFMPNMAAYLPRVLLVCVLELLVVVYL